jgi:hypothetical protein
MTFLIAPENCGFLSVKMVKTNVAFNTTLDPDWRH